MCQNAIYFQPQGVYIYSSLYLSYIYLWFPFVNVCTPNRVFLQHAKQKESNRVTKTSKNKLTKKRNSRWKDFFMKNGTWFETVTFQLVLIGNHSNITWHLKASILTRWQSLNSKTLPRWEIYGQIFNQACINKSDLPFLVFLFESKCFWITTKEHRTSLTFPKIQCFNALEVFV